MHSSSSGSACPIVLSEPLAPGVAAGSGDALATTQGSPQGLMPIAHQGVVFVDPLPGKAKMVVTNVCTQEQREIDGTGWFIECSPEGYGCLASRDAPEVYLLEDFLRLQVFVDADGNRFIKDGPDSEPAPMSNDWRRYEPGEARLPHGPTAAKSSMQFYRLHKLSGGMRFMWCLTSVYHRMGLKCFKKYPSKWAYEGFSPWKAYLTSMGFPAIHLMLSVVGLSICDAASSLCRFLPTAAASTLAILALLVRWSVCGANRGGMKDDSARRAASEFFKAFVSWANQQGATWSLVLDLVDDHWRCTWPRPQPAAEQFVLHVDDEGGIDLNSWEHTILAANLAKGHPLRRWFHALNASAAIPMNVAELLERSCSSAACQGLFPQVLWQTACRVDSAVEASLGAGYGGPCVCSLTGADALWGSAKEVDYNLAKYLASCQTNFCKPQFMSLATDKASVRGLSLSNTVAVMPNNLAMIMAPQVALEGTPVVWRSRFRAAAVFCPETRLWKPSQAFSPGGV